MKAYQPQEQYISWSQPFLKIARLAIIFKFLRKLLLDYSERKLYKVIVENDPEPRPRAAKEETYFMVRAILRSIYRALNDDIISDHVKDVILKIFVSDILLGDTPRRRQYIEKYHFSPPTFLTISPYKGCNLRCTGCYAASGATFRNTLPFSIVQKIVDQAKELWGSRFFVISGGEPLLYRSEGKTILDLYEQNPDCYFLMYTNGTLITPQVAQRMERTGNVTPAISIEGFEEETDKRRGKGVFRQILKAVHYLQEAGVPYGFSGTITRANAHIFMDDRLVDFYFHELKGIYMWLFHYMPIGRDIDVERQPSPEQRLQLFYKQREWIHQGYFLVDFWNDGIITDGCLCAGRPGGYMYIDWDGNVMPCVFVPYSTHNIKDVFARGGTLNDVLQAPLMRDLREWQRSYSYQKRRPEEVGNQITPCPHRDHYRDFYQIITKNKARPVDENSRMAIQNPDYRRKMMEYDDAVQKLTRPVWEKEYLKIEQPENPASKKQAS